MTPEPPQPPLYARIAASLRGQIEAGELQPGDRIPSENQLADIHSTTRPTVSRAIQMLRSEGLVESAAKSGTFVRRRPAIETRSSTFYRRAKPGEPGSPFARDAKREGKRSAWDSETARTRADEVVAERLGISAGDHVMRTRYLFTANGEPVMMSTSWEPFALVGGTAIEEPEANPGEPTAPRGVLARMDSIGFRADRVVEMVHARIASANERRVLDIAEDIWVQNVDRTYWARETAIETATIVIPADRYRLEYVIPID
jgi:DNA-binding GntR family transcriptional regulator